MKIKQELVSLVTLTLDNKAEIEAFKKFDFEFKEVKSQSHDLMNHKASIMAYIKLSDFPKLQRFVRKYKKSNLS